MLFKDAKLSFRRMARRPAFALTVVFTLALGIGVNTAAFSVADHVFLRPHSFIKSARVVAIETVWPTRGQKSRRVTDGDFVDFQSQLKGLQAISYYSTGRYAVRVRDRAVFASAATVNAAFGDVFGVVPSAGRLFTEADAYQSVDVSKRFAIKRFGAAANALGQSVVIDNLPMQIVGVLPDQFDFPTATDIWIAGPSVPDSLNRTAFNYEGVVALLKSSVSLASANAQLQALALHLQENYPISNRDRTFILLPLTQQIVGPTQPIVIVLISVTTLILLISCVNVANLQLARASEQEREWALSLALGASPWQLVRSVLIDGMFLSLSGCFFGVAFSRPFAHLLVRFIAPTSDLAQIGRIQISALSFALGLSVVSALIITCAPAIRVLRQDANSLLSQNPARGLTGAKQSRFRQLLVISEMAAAFTLLVSSGLLLRTLINITTAEAGYDKNGLVVAEAAFQSKGRQQAEEAVAKFDGIFRTLAALPGVEGVAGVSGLPNGGFHPYGSVATRSSPSLESMEAPRADFIVVSPGYFDTMRIHLIGGREFLDQDIASSQPVAIISESLATTLFPKHDAIGQLIKCGLDASDTWMQIVGVAKDIRQDSFAGSPAATLYLPMKQHPFKGTQISIVLRTKVAPTSLLDAVQASLLRSNPALATNVTTMNQIVDTSVAVQRARGLMITAFALIGTFLAILGVYGSVAYSMAQRRFEIGVRFALGASRFQVGRMVMTQILILTALGLTVGALASLVLSRFFSSMLVGLNSLDLFSLIGAGIILSLTAFLAGLVPARNAARVSPSDILRA